MENLSLTCAVDDCQKLKHKRGYCSAHYQSERASGRLGLINGDPCSVEGCGTTATCKGLCSRHYTRVRVHGDPDIVLKKPIRRTATQKECVTCREMLPYEAFNRAAKAKDGRQGMCRICTHNAAGSWYDANRTKARDDAKRWNAEHPERVLDHHYMVRYGIAYADYVSMFDAQGGVCAICGKPQPNGRRLYVDHDHYSGKVRSLLCRRCNSGIGNFLEDEALLAAASGYITRHRAKTH